MSLGLAHASQGDVEEAIGLYERALVIAREIGDLQVEGASLGNMGVELARLGERARGIVLLEQALRIGQQIGDPQMVGVFSDQLMHLRGKKELSADQGLISAGWKKT